MEGGVEKKAGSRVAKSSHAVEGRKGERLLSASRGSA
jgi:hypothetical protein